MLFVLGLNLGIILFGLWCIVRYLRMTGEVHQLYQEIGGRDRQIEQINAQLYALRVLIVDQNRPTEEILAQYRYQKGINPTENTPGAGPDVVG